MFVFYTNFGVPSLAKGAARGPCIFIRPEYKGDKGLLEHEKVHVKQWYFTLGLHSLLYLVFKCYKYRAEVAAYKKQLEYQTDKELYARKYAYFLSTRYGFKVSEERAYQKLIN